MKSKPFIQKHTVFSTEASVESVDTYLFHTRLTRSVVKLSFHLRVRGTLQHARLL